MTTPFQHPAAEELLERLSLLFNKKTVWLRARSQLVFVCGGSVADGAQTVRKKFLDWATQNVQGFRFLLAEIAAADAINYDEPRFLNIAQFETVLAEVADCIILIPESVGSWTEIGFFSAKSEISKKCLIFNAINQQGDSFLNVGPIQTINESSRYRPTVLADFAMEPVNFHDIVTKLQRFSRSKRQRFEMGNFDSLSGHQQFAIVHYIISIFPSLDVESLIDIFRKVFSRYRQERIKQLVSVLIAGRYASRVPGDEFRFFSDLHVPALMEIEGVTRDALLAEHLAFFEKYAPDLIPSQEFRDAS